MKYTDKHIHIVSFDIPYPANYGGVIDVFYRIKHISEMGVKVHLHCFEYGRQHSKILDTICHSVNYYKRTTSISKLFSILPYMVCSRDSKKLVSNLLQDDFPILLEGLHCCMLLKEKRLSHRKIYVRMHNVEHDYYYHLSKQEKNLRKKLYLKQEVSKLRHFEPILKKASGIIAITQKDADYFSQYYSNVITVSSFQCYNVVKSAPGQGTYALYHGQLSVAENYNAVTYLIEHIFRHTSIHFKVAGLNPPTHLVHLLSKYPNVTLVANPNEEEMQHMVQDAHVNILVTQQDTGFKLKLLNALYNGRFCLVNDAMVSGTQLDSLCIVANEPHKLKEKLFELFKKEFTQQDVELRNTKLLQLYNNQTSVIKLLDFIYNKPVVWE